jgi:cysteine-rich repeat protein
MSEIRKAHIIFALAAGLLLTSSLAACGGSGDAVIPDDGASIAVCGNAVMEDGEWCDDGNTVGGDGCSATCFLELTASFTDSGQRFGNSVSWNVALGDLDLDGDLDAFVTEMPRAPGDLAVSLWLNDGSGTFSDSGERFSPTEGIAASLGDLDGDGDLDAFEVKWWGAERVWMNGAL